MILVTGPTGSGKSTTLYATLNAVSKPEINVITVEDPVEYRLAGHQPGAGEPARPASRSRARCARSCDPTPTSSSSVRSATTRPRRSRSRRRSPVTSCCRPCTPTTRRPRSPDSPRWASSRSSSAPRSTPWSPSGSHVGSAGSARCPYSPSPQELEAARFPWMPGERAAGALPPGGCVACSKTGYRGRLALHEVMRVTRGHRAPRGRALVERGHRGDRAGPGDDLAPQRRLAKVALGQTSIEEILRVVA